MLVSLALVAVLGAAPDELEISRRQGSLQLQWADAEDRLQGTIRPADPLAGQPFQLSVNVGSFDGPAFDGPLTITLKGPGQTTESHTVTRQSGDKAWAASLTPPTHGEYSLEVAFGTTRRKVCRGRVQVIEGPLSRWPWYALLGAATVTMLGLGLRQALKKPETA